MHENGSDARAVVARSLPGLRRGRARTSMARRPPCWRPCARKYRLALCQGMETSGLLLLSWRRPSAWACAQACRHALPRHAAEGPAVPWRQRRRRALMPPLTAIGRILCFAAMATVSLPCLKGQQPARAAPASSGWSPQRRPVRRLQIARCQGSDALHDAGSSSSDGSTGSQRLQAPPAPPPLQAADAQASPPQLSRRQLGAAAVSAAAAALPAALNAPAAQAAAAAAPAADTAAVPLREFKARPPACSPYSAGCGALMLHPAACAAPSWPPTHLAMPPSRRW